MPLYEQQKNTAAYKENISKDCKPESYIELYDDCLDLPALDDLICRFDDLIRTGRSTEGDHRINYRMLP